METAIPPPQCIGVIIDGNRRWAKAHHRPSLEGHRAGYLKVRECIRWAAAAGVRHLIFYVFSTENWRRTPKEVEYLFRLLRMALRRELKSFIREGTEMRFIGFRNRISRATAALIHAAEKESKREDCRITATLAFDYGGRSEIIAAVKTIVKEAQNGSLDIDALDEEAFARRLWTNGIPDPDMIIRTGGEQRLSNFLCWQSGYSEFFFTPTLWPDFTESEFLRMLSEYHARERRFGK